MNSKRSESRLMFAMVLFGVLSTHLISADDSTVAVAGSTASYDQSVSQHSTAPAGVDTASAGSQETLAASAGGGGETLTAAETTQEVAETRTTAGQSSQQGAGGEETATAGGIPAGAETGTTVGESSPQGTRGEETATAGGLGALGAEGADTGTTAAASSSQEAVGGGTSTSAGELGTTRTIHVEIGTGSKETGTSPAESSTGGTGVRETVSTQTELGTGVREGGTSRASVQEYTTGRTPMEEITATVQITKETAAAEYTAIISGPIVAEEQTETTAAGNETKTTFISTPVTPTGASEKCEKWPNIKIKTRATTWMAYMTKCATICPINNETKSTTLARTTESDIITTTHTALATTGGRVPPAERKKREIRIRKETKKYIYCITTVFQNARNHTESRTFLWPIEQDSPLECNKAVVENIVKSNLKLPNKTRGTRPRRQADDEIIIDLTDEDMNLTLDDLEDAFKAIISDISEQSSIAASITSTTSATSATSTTSETSTTSAASTTSETSTTSAISTPQAVQGSATPGMRSVWEAHFGLFLTVIILIAVCIVVTSVCCLCMKWRGRERHPDKQPIDIEEARADPTSVSNPIPDAEMIRDEAPMQERENPAVTPNGGGQHISKADEDNGWVVPLDELSKAEKEKPEVENTRL